MSPDFFVTYVPDRSMIGHSVENGRLVENFEFRHLTFQEFLAARALVQGWYPGFQETDTLASVLEPHFEDEGMARGSTLSSRVRWESH